MEKIYIMRNELEIRERKNKRKNNNRKKENEVTEKRRNVEIHENIEKKYL